jgi:adenosylhomocysteine nucleosidase
MDMSDLSQRQVAIVAALEREVRPLLKRWRFVDKDYAGRRFRFFESGDAVLVCGGIGAEAARRAADAVIALYVPTVIYSAGFAGALDRQLKVGAVIQPCRVVNAGDGSSVTLEGGEGILVSFNSVASRAQKAKLRDSFSANAVDMEAAAVARAAQAREIKFAVVKVISDEWDFDFPSIEPFVSADGRFSEMRFALHVALRPWLWPKVVKLARNSSRAAEVLSGWLQKNVERNSVIAEPSEPVHSLSAVNRR